MNKPIIREASLKEIQSLFDKGTIRGAKYRTWGAIFAILVLLLILLANTKFSKPDDTILQFCTAISSFAVAYSSIAAGILVAGFSIIASGMDHRTVMAFSKTRKPVPTSNLLSFIFSIFVASLLVYCRLFAASLLGTTTCGPDRFLMFNGFDGNLPVYAKLLTYSIVGGVSYYTAFSISFLWSFILNLHSALALIIEVKARTGASIKEPENLDDP